MSFQSWSENGYGLYFDYIKEFNTDDLHELLKNSEYVYKKIKCFIEDVYIDAETKMESLSMENGELTITCPNGKEIIDSYELSDYFGFFQNCNTTATLLALAINNDIKKYCFKDIEPSTPKAIHDLSLDYQYVDVINNDNGDGAIIMYPSYPWSSYGNDRILTKEVVDSTIAKWCKGAVGHIDHVQVEMWG